VSTVAGSWDDGLKDGPIACSTFTYPWGIAVDQHGHIYISDSDKIRKISTEGEVSTFAGRRAMGYLDGPAEAALFNGPRGIAVDGRGNVYVADSGNNRIRRVSNDGTVSTFAGTGEKGNKDGEWYRSTFDWPVAVAVDENDNVYVADFGSHKIRKISKGHVSTIGSGDAAVAVDNRGNVYTTRGQQIYKISGDGQDVIIAGIDGPCPNGVARDGNGKLAHFSNPTSIAIHGDVAYIVDNRSHVRKLTLV